jgi:phosphoribosylaminoimidazole (AIR) synthetase
MEKKGELLNQLAIISDLLEKINTQTESITVVLEMPNENFEKSFETIQKKYGRKIDKPESTFTINIGMVDIVFNKSNV